MIAQSPSVCSGTSQCRAIVASKNDASRCQVVVSGSHNKQPKKLVGHDGNVLGAMDAFCLMWDFVAVFETQIAWAKICILGGRSSCGRLDMLEWASARL
jgi:hypothetical protein